VNQLRVEQAMEVNPDILGSACPFCLTMFEDGVKAKEVADRSRPGTSPSPRRAPRVTPASRGGRPARVPAPDSAMKDCCSSSRGSRG